MEQENQNKENIDQQQQEQSNLSKLEQTIAAYEQEQQQKDQQQQQLQAAQQAQQQQYQQQYSQYANTPQSQLTVQQQREQQYAQYYQYYYQQQQQQQYYQQYYQQQQQQQQLQQQQAQVQQQQVFPQQAQQAQSQPTNSQNQDYSQQQTQAQVQSHSQQAQEQNDSEKLQQEEQKRLQLQKEKEEQLRMQLAGQNLGSYDQLADKNKLQEGSRWSKPIIVTHKLYEILKIPPPQNSINDQQKQQNGLRQLQAPQQNQFQNVEWPEGLKNFIKKAFEKCKTLKDQQEMYNQLPTIIKQSQNQGDFLTKDWENTQTPLTQKEKMEQFQKQQEEKLYQHQQVLQQQRENEEQHKREEYEKKQQEKNGLKRPNPYVSDKTVVKPSEVNNANGGKKVLQITKPAPQNVSKYMKYQEYNFQDIEKHGKIVGTFMELEKKYVRSMQEPQQSEIRPESILKKSLKLIMQKWKNKDVDYNYMQDQFRSIRQDLVVQRIRNEFTVKVCEHNARICLEGRDIMQFMECCTTLFELYNENIKGQKEEFICYKMIHHHLNGQTSHLQKYMSMLEKVNEEDLMIQYFKDLYQATTTGNVSQFFILYKEAPKMTQYIIDTKLEKMRLWGILQICKGFGQSVQKSFIQETMGFYDDEHFNNFLNNIGIKDIDQQDKLNLKETQKLIQKYQQSKKL